MLWLLSVLHQWTVNSAIKIIFQKTQTASRLYGWNYLRYDHVRKVNSLSTDWVTPKNVPKLPCTSVSNLSPAYKECSDFTVRTLLTPNFLGATVVDCTSEGKIMSVLSVFSIHLLSDLSGINDTFSWTSYFTLGMLCGGNVWVPDTQPRVITSPNYPGQYPNDTYCEWTISAVPGAHLRVYLHFRAPSVFVNKLCFRSMQ